jgi:DNA-binding PadR family transcriptional regulator
VERARLAGTAKETILLAMLSHQGFLTVREIMEKLKRKWTGPVVSVPAVYRALAILDEKAFIAEADPSDDARAIVRLQARKPPGFRERPLLRYQLTDKGRIMALMLKLGQMKRPVTPRTIQRMSNEVYATLADSALERP